MFRDHLHRDDFHRWVEDVFGDRDLGDAIRRIEQRDAPSAHESIVSTIRERYLGTRS